jgi:hypothetical protein
MANDTVKREAGEFPLRVDRNVYPRPEYRFPDVKIGVTYQDSVADFPRPAPAPAGAPNVLLVLLDDVGFGWSSAFGGVVRMPTAERLADEVMDKMTRATPQAA